MDLSDPTLPIPSMDALRNLFGLAKQMATPPDPYQSAGEAVQQYRAGKPLSAFETMFGAMPATGSFTHPLYHGSPKVGLKELKASEHGPLGPGVYASDAPQIAEMYKREGGELYKVPHEKLDIYRGQGHRADDEYFGWKSDKERLMNAVEPDKRDAVVPLIDKMWSSDGYPLYARLVGLYGGHEGAQGLFKRAGFHGLSGLVDGPETVIFDNVKLAAEPKGIVAYHGSPHSFDRFDLSKIGTGEGAQAYGHGLYFSQAEDVAKSYRDGLSRPEYVVSGKKYPTALDASQAIWDMPGLSEKARYEAGWHINRNYPLNEALDHLQKNSPKDYEALKIAIDSGRIAELPNPGHMYEVRINAEPEHFLDWDKPLLEQSKHIQEKLSAARPELFSPVVTNPRTGLPVQFAQQKTPEQLRQYAEQMGYPITEPANLLSGQKLVFEHGETPASASQRLKEAGIPGIKYLDQGSRGAGEGSRNYVVFDDKLIDIMRKYGFVPFGAGVGMQYGEQSNQK